jgi:hypothetical protein
MKILDDFMPLEDGEEVVTYLEGNAYNADPNIFVRLISFIDRIFAIILGYPRKMHIIVTTRRVIAISIQKKLWFMVGKAAATSIMPRSIQSTGYVFMRSFIFFKSHYLEFASGGGANLIKSKMGKDKVYEMIKKIVLLAERTTTK